MERRTVLQDWVCGLSFMQQTVLLTAVRGPDGQPKYGAIKYLLRWYRRCILISSLDQCVITDPHKKIGGSFMGPSYEIHEPMADQHGEIPWQVRMDRIVDAYLRDLDAIPHHFQMHFMHSAEIVGYKHSIPEIRDWWRSVYYRLVHDMHVWPETEPQLDRRLGDSRDTWLERADAATVE